MVLKVSKIALKGCTRFFGLFKWRFSVVTLYITVQNRTDLRLPTGYRPEMSRLLASDYTLTGDLTLFNTKPTYYLHIASFHWYILALRN